LVNKQTPQAQKGGLLGSNAVLAGLVVLALVAVGALVWLGGQRPIAPPTPTATTKAPTATTAKIETGTTPEGHPYKGSPKAKVTLIEFSDYQ
jgi:hypothetical protein